jgi:hypothetical protein
MSQSCSYFIFNIRIKQKRSLQSAVQFTFKMYILSLNALAFFLFFSFVRVLQECSCYWPWYSMGYGRVLSTSSLSLFLSFSLYSLSLSLPLSEVAFDWICANTHMANALMWVSCNTKTRKKQVLFSDLKHISTFKKIYFDLIWTEGMADSQSWRVKKFRWFKSNQSTAPRFVSII